MILALVYGYIPYLILPLYASLDRIDKSHLEAARDLGASPFRTFLHVTLPLSKTGILGGCVLIALPMFGDYYTPNIVSGAPTTSMLGNQIDLYFHGTSQPTDRRGADDPPVAVPRDPDGLLHRDGRIGRPRSCSGMTVDGRPADPSDRRSPGARMRGWITNPWGRPRFLVVITWVYMALGDRAGADRRAVLVQRQPLAHDLGGVLDTVVLRAIRPTRSDTTPACTTLSRRASSWPPSTC